MTEFGYLGKVRQLDTTPQSFMLLSDGYARDDKHIFWGNRLVDADFDSFRVMEDGDAEDNYRYFSWNNDKKESTEVIAMTNLQLNPGESRIGQGLVSYRDLEKHTYQCWHATIYVTNQRVFLDTYTGIELKLSKIRGFTFGRILLFFPSVTIFGQAEKTVIGEHGLTEDAYTFTGFPIKKLKGWLQQAGIQEL